MSVKIKLIKDNTEYEINGNLVYKDELGNWQSVNEISKAEKTAFKNYYKLLVTDSKVRLRNELEENE
jgi:hypothetical protein